MAENEAGGRVLAAESLGPTITIGEILVEIMADAVGHGFLEPVKLTGPYPSGAPAIFIDQVARMGASAGIVAAVGDDDFGRVNLRRLEADGVDISAIAIAPRHPTGTAFVRYRPDGGRDFVFNIALSAAGEIDLTADVRALIGRAGHLHLMGTALSIPRAWPVIVHAMEEIGAKGGTVSFDPNVRKELLASPDFGSRFNDVLKRTDLLLPSGEEILVAAEAESEAEAVETLFRRGIGEIVMKRGADGASVFTPSGRIDVAGHKVEEIDPTGAGDCFGGAYVACRRLGMPAAQALTYANAAGALAVTKRGPMEGAATRADLDAFLAHEGRG